MISLHAAHSDRLSHVSTLWVLTLLPAHSFQSISSCSYLWETMPGLWGLLFHGDTVRVSAASWGLGERTFSPEWSHTCYRNQLGGKTTKDITQDKHVGMPIFVNLMDWVMFISSSLRWSIICYGYILHYFNYIRGSVKLSCCKSDCWCNQL